MRYAICAPVIWVWAGCGPVPGDTVGSVVSCRVRQSNSYSKEHQNQNVLQVRADWGCRLRLGQIRAYVRFDREREGRVFCTVQRVVCNVHLLTVPLSARAGRGHTDTVQYETQRVRAALPCTGFTEVYYARQQGRPRRGGAEEACKRQGLTYSMCQSLPRRYAQSTHTPLSALFLASGQARHSTVRGTRYRTTSGAGRAEH